MRRRLTDEQVWELFQRRLRKTGDTMDAALTVYEAGRGLAGTATRPRRPRRAPAPPSRARIEAARRRAAPVLAAVSLFRRVSVEEMLGPSQKARVAGPRNEVVWLLRRQDPRQPFLDCALAVGRTDHKTAVNSDAEVEKRIAADPGLRDWLLMLVEPAARARGAA